MHILFKTSYPEELGKWLALTVKTELLRKKNELSGENKI